MGDYKIERPASGRQAVPGGRQAVPDGRQSLLILTYHNFIPALIVILLSE